MAGIQDFVVYEDDFIGASTFGAAAQGQAWVRTAATNGTAVGLTNTAGGAIRFSTGAIDETSRVDIAHGDILGFAAKDLDKFEARVKTVASVGANVSFGFGMQSARNNDLSTTETHAQFRCILNNNVVVETDDDVRDVSNVATGTTLGIVYKKFVIDFSGGLSNVKFYVDGQRVAAGQVFDMSAAADKFLQPFFLLQKAGSTQSNTADLDYIRVFSRR